MGGAPPQTGAGIRFQLLAQPLVRASPDNEASQGAFPDLRRGSACRVGLERQHAMPGGARFPDFAQSPELVQTLDLLPDEVQADSGDEGRKNLEDDGLQVGQPRNDE